MHMPVHPKAFIPQSPTCFHHIRKMFFTYDTYTRGSAPSKNLGSLANHSLPTATGSLRQQGAGLFLEELCSPGWIWLARPYNGETHRRGPKEKYCIYCTVSKLSPPHEEAQQGELLHSQQFSLWYLFPTRQGLGLVKIIKPQFVTSCPPFGTGSTIMLVCITQPLSIIHTIKFSF